MSENNRLPVHPTEDTVVTEEQLPDLLEGLARNFWDPYIEDKDSYEAVTATLAAISDLHLSMVAVKKEIDPNEGMLTVAVAMASAGRAIAAKAVRDGHNVVGTKMLVDAGLTEEE